MAIRDPDAARARSSAPEDTSGVRVWLLLRKAYLALGEHAGRQIDSLSVGPSEFRALEVLLAKGPLPINVIGPKVNLTTGSISVAVDRLVRKGLVRRRDDATDRRVRLVELTAKGRTVIKRGFRLHSQAMEFASADLTMAERRTLIPLLKKLGKGAEARSSVLWDIEKRRGNPDEEGNDP